MKFWDHLLSKSDDLTDEVSMYEVGSSKNKTGRITQKRMPLEKILRNIIFHQNCQLKLPVFTGTHLVLTVRTLTHHPSCHVFE